MARLLRRRAGRFGSLATVTGRCLPHLRCVTIVGLLLVLSSATAAQPDDASAVPRLPWGDPDLQGIWHYQTQTPLERPEAFADKAVLTSEEAAAYVAEQHALLDSTQLRGDWPDWSGLANRRTSLIIDPPNGRLPARTVAGQHRAETIGNYLLERAADGPEDRERLERCIMGRSVPFRGLPFEQRVQIFQTPDHVALQDEFGELRLVPLTDRARLPESIRQWGGQSRGHWDGDTLVVETTNFNGQWSLEGAGPSMRLVERFVRTAAGTLDYEYTVHDPESFASAWTVSFPFARDPGPIYDYACHEGNYSMPLILSGARAQEREEAASR